MPSKLATASLCVYDSAIFRRSSICFDTMTTCVIRQRTYSWRSWTPRRYVVAFTICCSARSIQPTTLKLAVFSLRTQCFFVLLTGSLNSSPKQILPELKKTSLFFHYLFYFLWNWVTKMDLLNFSLHQFFLQGDHNLQSLLVADLSPTRSHMLKVCVA